MNSAESWSRRRFIAASSAALAAACVVPDGVFATDEKRPNVLIIGGDDLGPQLGCYGDKTVPTPNIDALAARGTRFSRAYVTQASCSPSRSSMLTGLYPHQNGQLGLAPRGFQMTRTWDNFHSTFDRAGYHTGHLGKLHVEPKRAFRLDYRYPGYDTTRKHGTIRWHVKRFLEARRDKPFLLDIELADPHHPLLAEVDGLPSEPLQRGDAKVWSWTEPRKDEDLPAEVANYYNCIARLDALVGVIIEELRAAGELDNTLIVFWGDHGPPFRRGKTTAYEHGTHIPLIVAGPNVKAGQVRDELVSTVDVLPTLCAAAGMAVPTEPHAHRTGQSLVPLLGGKQAEWRDMLFTEMNFHTWWMYTPTRAVRDDRWKLIHNLDPGEGEPTFELYDLPSDPDERRNLAGQPAHAEHEQRLRTAMQAWREKTDDPLLDPAIVKRLATIPGNPKEPVKPWFRGGQSR